MWPNIDEAAHQVAKELNKAGNEKAFGIVAISLMVMFHLAVPWDMNEERLIHTAMSNFVKVGKCAEGWETLSQNLPSLY